MDPRVARFGSMRSCFGAIRAWQEWHELRGRAGERVERLSCNVRYDLFSSSKNPIGEREAKGVLKEYGIACVPERTARNAEEAVKAAAELGYPVVLKADAPEIAHKTEAGAVKLDLRDADAVRAACKAMTVAKTAFSCSRC